MHSALVALALPRHKRRVSIDQIFDRATRRRARDRAAPGFGAHDFLRQVMAEAIAERLAMVKRDFAVALDLGCHDATLPLPATRIIRCDAGGMFARRAGGIQADEDRLPLADHSVDLVVSAGVLDQLNDVPGALTLARRSLKPDGLFLAAFLGAGSLSTLRAVLRDAEGDRPAARIHPQIDVRAAGDLLVRAGFALPVADAETLTVRYRDLFALIRDLRGMAMTNMLIGRKPLRRDTLARAAAAFGDRADAAGRTAETFSIVFLTGWAPAPTQPTPARRGSATASLAAALRPPR